MDRIRSAIKSEIKSAATIKEFVVVAAITLALWVYWIRLSVTSRIFHLVLFACASYLILCKTGGVAGIFEECAKDLVEMAKAWQQLDTGKIEKVPEIGGDGEQGGQRKDESESPPSIPSVPVTSPLGPPDLLKRDHKAREQEDEEDEEAGWILC